VTIYVGGPDGLSWDDARAKVRGDLWRPGNSLPDDVVNRALHASVLELEAECNWLWLENLTTLVTLEGDASFYDIPPTVSRVIALTIVEPVYSEPLDQRPLSVVRIEADRIIGDPSCFAFGNARLWFDTTVAAGTKFEMVFSAATPEELEQALLSPCFTLQRQQQAVIANACAYVALTFMKNADEAGRQSAAYDRVLQRLHNTEAQQRGGMIQADTWGMGCG
jgi:hypothetical protein